MDKKLKECLTPHALMHTLFGLGLGIILVSLFPGLQNLTFGVIVAGVAIALDYMRK